MKRVLQPLKKRFFRTFLAPFFKLIEVAGEMITPFLVKDVIDEGIPNLDLTYSLTRALIMLGIAVVSFVVTMVTQYLAAAASADYAKDIRGEVHDHLNLVSDLQVEKFGKDKLLTVMTNDTFAMQNALNHLLRLLVRCPFVIIGSIVSAFIISPITGFIVLGSAILCFIVLVGVTLLLPERYIKVQSAMDDISTKADDAITGHKVIKGFNKQGEILSDVGTSTEQYRRESMGLFRINSLVNPLTMAFTYFVIFLVVYLLRYDGSGTFKAGTCVAVMTYMTQALAAIIMFSRTLAAMTKGVSSAKRVEEFLSIDPEIKEGKEDCGRFKEGEPMFELRDVSASFGGDLKALESISFKVSYGERIGVIGGTGSGKSVLISVLERTLEAEGEILVHGKPIKDCTFSSYRSQIALVSQKPSIFHGSIKENLLVGDGAREADVKWALEKACADFVYELGGLDYMLEERGSNLSGGQRQRLLIARALLSKRPLLIMDDSTSALDFKTDKEVRQNIKKSGVSSLILISQRVSSIKDCDRIYVMDKGKVVAVGTHEELLKTCKLYKEIEKTQLEAK